MNWEGGLAGGLLRWNRPPSSQSWYQGRGGEQKKDKLSNLVDSVFSFISSELRIPNLGVIFRFRFRICASLEQLLLVVDVAVADGEGANQNQAEE